VRQRSQLCDQGVQGAPIIRTGSASGPLEGRLPLLHESRHALEEVVGSHERMLDIGLEVELTLEIAVEHAVERLLGSRIRARRALGELACELERLVSQLVAGHYAVDQAPVERLLGAHALAEQRELERARL